MFHPSVSFDIDFFSSARNCYFEVWTHLIRSYIFIIGVSRNLFWLIHFQELLLVLGPNMVPQVLDAVELWLALRARVADYIHCFFGFWFSSGSLIRWTLGLDDLDEVVAIFVVILVWHWFGFDCVLVCRWQEWEAADILMNKKIQKLGATSIGFQSNFT